MKTIRWYSTCISDRHQSWVPYAATLVNSLPVSYKFKKKSVSLPSTLNQSIKFEGDKKKNTSIMDCKLAYRRFIDSAGKDLHYFSGIA